MVLTCESMDQGAEPWHDESSAPDAPDEQPLAVSVVVLIADGDLRVDPLDLF